MRRLKWLGALLALVSASAVLAGGKAEKSRIPDFTFIHCSDIHVPPGVQRHTTGPNGGPGFGSAEVVAQIKTLTAPIEMTPYHLTVPAPTFAIATGDMTEFGGLNGWWEDYLSLWKDAPFPVYHISGNHDSTWASQRFRLRQIYGAPFYSFNQSGCHFIAWDSASIQDPRPSFGEEELNWLRQDLKNLDKSTPVFLFCHHPIDGNEFASLYERDRLLDVLRPYNLVLLMVGHGHGVQHKVVAGVDQEMGGSTFGAAPGYAVVSVKDGVLRVAYRRAWSATPQQAVLEKPLPLRANYPEIRIDEPKDGATLSGGALRVRLRIDRPSMSCAWLADDEKGRTGNLAQSGGAWEAAIDVSAWDPGCHYLRFTFKNAEGREFQRTGRLYIQDSERRVAWRTFMQGSGKGTPLITGDLLITGGQDGVLYAFERKSGKRRWSFKTGGEILAQPLVAEGRIYVGSGDTRFYCVGRGGKQVWSADIGHPVYSSAVNAGGKIVVAANNGHIYGFAPDTGEKLWECAVPQYSIESRPCVARDGSTVYFGCWDGYVYAVDSRDGSVRWRTQGVGSKASLPGVARYYAPADAGPVLADDRLWIADRLFRVSVLNASTGEVIGEDKAVSSTALSEDGRFVYLRGTDGNLRKVTPEGTPVWTAAARTSFLPSAPSERDGVVYSATATGQLIAFEASSGKRLWNYQCTPGLYVFSDPVSDGERVYVTGMDGSVTAFRAH